jgi:hypothetical protein
MESMMEVSSEKAMMYYAEAYQKLYNRRPKDLRAIENGWVIVNGARMRVTELEHLTLQLQREFNQGLDQRRNVVSRLLKWFQQKD